jgi:hypothetical protein
MELNLCLDLELRVQKDNFATFMDEKQNQWTLGFDSLDVLVNLVKQFILCKTVFRLYFLTFYLYEGFCFFAVDLSVFICTLWIKCNILTCDLLI